MGVENPEAVSVAQVDSNGKLYVDLYDDKKDRPRSTKEKELILTLEKVYAELDTFSRETGNEENGKLFSQYADQTGAILSELKTRLLKAEEMKE